MPFSFQLSPNELVALGFGDNTQRGRSGVHVGALGGLSLSRAGLHTAYGGDAGAGLLAAHEASGNGYDSDSGENFFHCYLCYFFDAGPSFVFTPALSGVLLLPAAPKGFETNCKDTLKPPQTPNTFFPHPQQGGRILIINRLYFVKKS